MRFVGVGRAARGAQRAGARRSRGRCAPAPAFVAANWLPRSFSTFGKCPGVSRRLGPDGIAARDCGLRRVLTRSQRTTGLSGALKVSRQLSRLFDSWAFCE